jgi:hypothetical protein
MKRAATTGSSLDSTLKQRMQQQARQQAMTPSPHALVTRIAWERYWAGEVESPTLGAKRMGITFDVDGKKYDWDANILRTPQGRATVREVLPKLKQRVMDNPKHAYWNTRDPNHAAAVAEMREVNRWLKGEMTPQEEGEMAKGLLSAFEKPALPEAPTAIAELAQLRVSPEYKRAQELMRGRTTNPKLNDPDHHAERLALNREAELEAAIKATEPKRQDVAYDGSPKSPGGRMQDTSRYLASSILELSKLPPAVQANRAREMAAAMRNDPRSAYNDPSHSGHAQAVAEMQQLYQAQYYESGDPVISDEQK